MLQQINASLRPIMDDFDRYWAWQHRKARLEADLREVEAELAELHQLPKTIPPWWHWLKRAGWLGSLILAVNQEVFRLLDEPPHRLERVEYLRRTQAMLQQQIDLLAQQMSHYGDPSEVYQDLLDLKKDWLLQGQHPHGAVIQDIQGELGEQEQQLALLDEGAQAADTALRALETLAHTVEKTRDQHLIFSQRAVFPGLRRPYVYRMRRNLHVAHVALIQLAELLRQQPDYELIPPDLQASYLEAFHSRFRRHLMEEGFQIRDWSQLLDDCWQAHKRVESLLAWMQRSVEAIEQRHTFLLRKQERLIREAE